MGVDPSSPYYEFYTFIINMEVSFSLFLDSVSDPLLTIIKWAWTLCGLGIFISGIGFYIDRWKVERERKRKHFNGLQKIHSQKWLKVSSAFIWQSVVIIIVGFIAIMTPSPVRPQLTLYTLVTSGGFIFMAWQSYYIVMTFLHGDRQAIEYIRTHRIPTEEISLLENTKDWEV